ncbi:hypothetical protein D3C85_1489470 [compost metagenome]
MTGFSEVMGSWKIMEISLPRIRRSADSSSLKRSTSWPSRGTNRAAPDAMRPPARSMRRRMDKAVTDLPEPDSPTSATVSPRPMVKSSDLTAR